MAAPQDRGLPVTSATYQTCRFIDLLRNFMASFRTRVLVTMLSSTRSRDRRSATGSV
jgi:hypothetical protein